MNKQCTNHPILRIAIPKCVSMQKWIVLGNKGVKTTPSPVFRSVIGLVVSEEMLKKNLLVISPIDNARTTQNREFEDQNGIVTKNGLF